MHFFLHDELLPSLIAAAADAAETALRLRAAEARFVHRAVTRRVTCGVLVHAEAADARFAPPPRRRVARHAQPPGSAAAAARAALEDAEAGPAPAPPFAGLLAASGASLFLANVAPPAGATVAGARAPLRALASPLELGGSAPALFAHVFDLLDFDASGALPLAELARRAARDAVAWAALSSDAPIAVAPLGGVGGGAAPTAHQIWQRLVRFGGSAAGHSHHGHEDAAAPRLSREAFAALFRPLHVLDIVALAEAPALLDAVTAAHAGRTDLLDDGAAAFWGAEWDAARAAAPLIDGAAADEVAAAFAEAHALEALAPAAAWAAGERVATTAIAGDPRHAPPTDRLLSLAAARALCFALDGDAPTETELAAHAADVHAAALRAERRARRAARGENPDEADDDVDSVLHDEEDEDENAEGGEAKAKAEAAAPPRLPREAPRGLTLSALVALRVVRDEALAAEALGASRMALATRVPGAAPHLPPPALGGCTAALALERRRLFPMAGVPRARLVRRRLREAFRDVRQMLVDALATRLMGASFAGQGVA
jgi:hypothetical protein